MSEQNKITLLKANAAISEGDHEAFLACCTEDTLWNFIGDKTLRGKGAVRQWIEVTYVEPPQFDVAFLVAEGDYVTAVGEITMKDEDGKPARYSYCDVWRFQGDRMAELKAFVIKTKDTPE